MHRSPILLVYGLITVFHCFGSPTPSTRVKRASCNSIYGSWSEWGACSMNCGFCGKQNRTRTCAPVDGCTEPICLGDSAETRSCGTDDVVCFWPTPSCCNSNYKKTMDVAARRFYCGLKTTSVAVTLSTDANSIENLSSQQTSEISTVPSIVAYTPTLHPSDISSTLFSSASSSAGPAGSTVPPSSTPTPTPDLSAMSTTGSTDFTSVSSLASIEASQPTERSRIPSTDSTSISVDSSTSSSFASSSAVQTSNGYTVSTVPPSDAFTPTPDQSKTSATGTSSSSSFTPVQNSQSVDTATPSSISITPPTASTQVFTQSTTLTSSATPTSTQSETVTPSSSTPPTTPF